MSDDEPGPDIDIVKIGKEYVSQSDITYHILQALDTHAKNKNTVEKISALGNALILALTMHHQFVEDFFATMIDVQARMIKAHNKVCPDCNVFRRAGEP